MRAELLKLRALPTPRWAAAGCFAGLGIALILGAIFGVGHDEAVLGLGAELPTALAGMVLGAWIVGLEYGQGTMRRTLTADPRRARLVRVKLATALLATSAVTAGVFLVSAAVYPAISDASVGDVLTEGGATLVSNLAGCVIGATITLLTRSMAGGVSLALFAWLGLDSALGAIPTVGKYTLGHSTTDLSDVIRNTASDPDVVRAIVVLAVWMAALTLAGTARFARADA